VAAGDRGEGFVGALEDALRADVDPAAGRHLAVHRQAAVFEVAELVPRGPGRHEQRIGDDDARRPRVGPEHRDRFARLHDQGLVVIEAAEGRHDGVERRPAAGSATRTAVNHQIVGAFGHLRIEVVHQHSERGFLRPALTRNRRAARRHDLPTQKVHVRLTIAVAGCQRA
jgi:hypothetical protein